jgi:alkylation response protein AidB-like acyl-CoA dehydrogenase
MDLNYSPEETAFRDDARGWLDQNLPADLRDKVLNYKELAKDDLERWHKILAKKGWVAPDWPTEWGGTGWNVVQRYIFEEECGYAGTPPLVAFGLRMCAPVLLRFGTDAQKQRFLPKIYGGEEFWCQGYSEPGSGSDLASLKTRAARENGHYVVTGQKIWTTLAHYADWIFRSGPHRCQDRQASGRHLLPADRHEDAGHHRAADLSSWTAATRSTRSSSTR